MYFSIIIITRNRADIIRNTLKAVQALDYPRDEFELIVVDNGSNDGTSGFVQKIMEDGDITWKVIEEPVAGICRARNAGLAHATGEWIAFLDDDALIPREWLCSYQEAIRLYSDAVAFGGPAKLGADIPRPWWWIDVFDKAMSCQNYGCDYAPYLAGTNPYGLNMLIKRDCLRQLNGFDTSLDRLTHSFADETELFLRLRKRGGKVIYVPDAEVIHSIKPDRLEWSNFMKRFYMIGRSHACLDYLHGTVHARSLLRRMVSALVLFIRYGSPAVFITELQAWMGYRQFRVPLENSRTD